MTHSDTGLHLMLSILGCLVLGGAVDTRLLSYEPLAFDAPLTLARSRYPENSHDNQRSLEMDDFKVEVVPTSGKVSMPTILRLHPSVAKATPLHANLPLRFGRELPLKAVRTPKSSLNLPQRFGRSQATDVSVIVPCHQCPRSGGLALPSATLPQRFGRTAGYRGRLDTVAVVLRGAGSSPEDTNSREEDYSFDTDSVEEATDPSPEEFL